MTERAFNKSVHGISGLKQFNMHHYHISEKVIIPFTDWAYNGHSLNSQRNHIMCPRLRKRSPPCLNCYFVAWSVKVLVYNIGVNICTEIQDMSLQTAVHTEIYSNNHNYPYLIIWSTSIISFDSISFIDKRMCGRFSVIIPFPFLGDWAIPFPKFSFHPDSIAVYQS